MNPPAPADSHTMAGRRRRSLLISHLLAYFVVAVVLVPVNFILTPGIAWFFYPLVLWMAPLAIHTAFAMGLFDTASRPSSVD